MEFVEKVTVADVIVDAAAFDTSVRVIVRADVPAVFAVNRKRATTNVRGGAEVNWS